jgi:hypothetical protein
VVDQRLRVLASTGLAVGGIFGMAGTFAPSAALRGRAWGIDGVALVMAGAILTVVFYRTGQDLVASGFLILAIGEGIILSGTAMDLDASVPSFGAGSSLWALALILVSVPPVFPFLYEYWDSSPRVCLWRRHSRSSRAFPSHLSRPHCLFSSIRSSSRPSSAGFGRS